MADARKIITEAGEPVVHFDLDALEHEATAEPFTFRLGGDVFTAISPTDADWQATADTETPGGLKAFMGELLGDDYDRFAEHRLSNEGLGKLIEACQKHYGVKTGESKASPRSSNGRRKR